MNRIYPIQFIPKNFEPLNGRHFYSHPFYCISFSFSRKALDSAPFKEWKRQLIGPRGLLNPETDGSAKSKFTLRSITIQNVDMFGSRVGFLKFLAEVVHEDSGVKLPGIVFARGGAVGVLILLKFENECFAILTEQARVPVGRTILELPAGMLDDDVGDFVGTAAREVEEETGIPIHASQLIDLTSFLDKSTGQKMFPSPGGSDEEIKLFLYRGIVEKEVIQKLQGREAGLKEHGEIILVRAIPYHELWKSSADSKVLCAISLYENALREKLISQW